MNETAKTLGFIATAALLSLVAWALNFSPTTNTASQAAVGSLLFENFKDPRAAKKMEIIRFDEKQALAEPFVVEFKNNAWRLPSRQDYPADAQEQMVKAANLLIGLKVNSQESDSASTHGTFGLLDPAASNLQPGVTGIGKRINLYDENGNRLAELIVGKQVKDRPGLYYVRNGASGRNQVYTANIEVAALTTNFADWIEKDLLKLDAFDIKELELNDYSIQIVQQGGQAVAGLSNNSLSRVAYDSKKGEWGLSALQKFETKSLQSGSWVDDPLTAEEELNTQALNDARYALDDLRIVDVFRKPANLGADLTAEKALADDLAVVQELQSKGYFLVPDPKDETKTQIFSENGEIVCRMNSGVEYVLRFGKVIPKGLLESIPEEKAETKPGEPEVPKEEGDRRFLMVAARFNPDLVTKPVLESVPQSLEELRKSQSTPAGSEAPSTPDAPGTSTPTGTAAPNGGATEGAAPDQPATGNEGTTETPAAAPESTTTSTGDDATAPSGGSDEATPALPENSAASETAPAAPSTDTVPQSDAAPAEAPATVPQTDLSVPDAGAPAPSQQTSKGSPVAGTNSSLMAELSRVPAWLANSLLAQVEAPAAPPAGDSAAVPSTDEAPVASTSGETPVASSSGEAPEAQSTASEAGSATPAPATKSVTNVEQAELIAAQERVTAANSKKQRDYDDKLKSGEAKVKQLNERFADWYYVISDSVYKKVRLGRNEIIKLKEAPAAEGEAPSGLEGALPGNFQIPGLGQGQ